MHRAIAASPRDLGNLSHPRLRKHCQQHDPPLWRDPVRHPYRPAVQVEAQLPQLAVELARVGLAEERSSIRHQIDVERCRRKLSRRQRLEPVPNFRFEFDGSLISASTSVS
jgi:hypothetical protein